MEENVIRLAVLWNKLFGSRPKEELPEPKKDEKETSIEIYDWRCYYICECGSKTSGIPTGICPRCVDEKLIGQWTIERIGHEGTMHSATTKSFFEVKTQGEVIPLNQLEEYR